MTEAGLSIILERIAGELTRLGSDIKLVEKSMASAIHQLPSGENANDLEVLQSIDLISQTLEALSETLGSVSDRARNEGIGLGFDGNEGLDAIRLEELRTRLRTGEAMKQRAPSGQPDLF